jgi:quercetin dioxygenase-like cupin family protein
VRNVRSRVLVVGGLAALFVASASLTLASAAMYVTPTLLNRATFDAFKVMSNPDDGGLVKLEAKSAIDVVVRRHDYAPGGSTGWHAHPYPVLITVKEGTLTFYEANDPTCTPIRLTAGQGYVDSGDGHLVRNESGTPAVDISVILAPVGAPFRTELPATNPNCGF